MEAVATQKVRVGFACGVLLIVFSRSMNRWHQITTRAGATTHIYIFVGALALPDSPEYQT
jgi:hypothetical protein